MGSIVLSFARRRGAAILEVLALVAVFYLQGGWPPPDVNEPYYLAKALHWWRPEWAAGDFFLRSVDAHLVFYVTFGWITTLVSLPAAAWIGRFLTWFLLAWSWRRLSWSLVPRAGFALLSATLFLFGLEHFHFAGEWVVGGVEAKGFAYAFLFAALAELVAGRWFRAWLWLGGATALHVLVGGWSVVAASLSWLMTGRSAGTFTPAEAMAPRGEIAQPPSESAWRWRDLAGLGPAFLLALPGLVPALLLDRGASADVVRQANGIYVYERLWHHLDPVQLALDVPWFAGRFLILVALWLIVARFSARNPATARFRWFVHGSLVLALFGVAVGMLQWLNRDWAAKLLRYYWFRLSDVAVPLGIALLATQQVAAMLFTGRRWWRFVPLALAAALAGTHLVNHLQERLDQIPATEDDYQEAWEEICAWIADSGNIPTDARFLTPRLAMDFKWRTGRAEVVNWKEVPQGALDIVAWWDRINEIFGQNPAGREDRWYHCLAERDAPLLRRLAAKYHADYILTFAHPRRRLPVVYRNDVYVVYGLRASPALQGSRAVAAGARTGEQP